MTSPAVFGSDMESAQSPTSMFGDIPTRQMRVKVLYTFDNENKTNCLARFPDVLNIPTVPIDETTQIGVMELRKCIQAIVSASPELVSRLNQGDFTIYAYDYSEYETPLVGQGMLSSALAGASPTPNAPAFQSKTMITGRVCQNVMGLFSNGVAETLEVKLRLVPVPRPVQNEYIKTMEMYRGISPATSAGFDPNAWSASLHQTAMALGAPFEEAPTPISLRNDAMDSNFDSQSNMHSQRPRHGSTASFHSQGQQAFHAPAYSVPVSRVNSPALSQHGPPHHHHARSLSRASIRSNASTRRRESFNENEQGQDEGPARKRVKVTQTEWRGKPALGFNSGDLRVTASTANSIRIHKPVPTRPGMPTNNSLEPPPRAPTPVPQALLPNANRQGIFLRRESSLARAQSYNSPYSQPVDMPTHSDVDMTPPEENNGATGSPSDFPSSPPLMPEPSSPGLPTMASFPKPMMDSGYMSSAFECHEDEEDREVDEEDMHMAQQYKPRESTSQIPFSDFIEQTPGPPALLPNRMQMDQSVRNAQDELSRQKARNAVLPPSERRNSIALPPNPKDNKPSLDTQKPAMNRSNTLISRSEAASPAPTDDGILPKQPRSGSGAKRKKTIQDKLVQAIAQGELPAFCGHCGSIETPTWRALFTKVIEGSPSELGPELDGVTMGTEIIDRDQDTGKITKYRIIKSTRKGKDPLEVKGYDALQVCNPCGLWFNKYKVMRPSDKWHKKPAKGRKRKTDTDLAGPQEPQSDFPQSDFYCDPQTDAVEPEEQKGQSIRGCSTEIPEAPLPANHPRASSEQPSQKSSHALSQWVNTDLDAALQRAIQSSPAGRSFQGTQESPIDLSAEDLTPKPVRRTLFPSPQKEGYQHPKCLDDTALPGSKAQSSTIIEAAFVVDPFPQDKENMPPPADTDDDLAHLFECSPGIFRTPGHKSTPNKHVAQKTPRIGSGNFEDLLKTPTPNRSSLKTLSSNARQAFTPRTCTNNSNSNAFLPTFTSAEKVNLNLGMSPRTPGRFIPLSSPSRANRGEMTPFTRQLTQLLGENGNSGAGGNASGNSVFGSPGRSVGFDFADLSSFMSPGRGLDFDKMEFNMDDFEGIDFSALPANAEQEAGAAGPVATGTAGSSAGQASQ